MPVLCPVQIQGCCCASSRQGNTFPLILDKAAAALIGLLGSAPSQIRATQGYSRLSGNEAMIKVPCSVPASCSLPTIQPQPDWEHLPLPPPHPTHVLAKLSQQNSPLTTDHSRMGGKHNSLLWLPFSLAQTCFIAHSQHPWAGPSLSQDCT